MGNLLPNNTTDFNLTNNFGEGDLDIGWAHLQVMKLWELSSDDDITIDGTSYSLKDTASLRNAIQKMYDLNVGAGIAAESLGDVYNPPERFSSESYVKIWRMNEIFDLGKFGKQPDKSKPTSLYESVDGDYSGTISGSFRWAVKSNQHWYIRLFSGASISLDDKREVSGNSFPYCISFAMYIAQLGDGVLLRKGDFYIELKNNKVFLKRTDINKVISFVLPSNLTANDLKGKWTEFRFVGAKIPDLTTGSAIADFKVFIDNKECQLLQKQFSNTIRTADEKQPFVFSCNPIAGLQNVRISKATLTFPEIAEDFAYDANMDLVSSFNYQKFENELLDNSGNSLPVTNFPGINNQNKVWTLKSETNGTGSFPRVTRVAKVGANRYITAPGLDISKNFTISFWFQAININDNLVLFDSVDGGKYFRAFFKNNKLNIQLPNATYEINSTQFSVNYTDWTHLVIIKNGEGLGVYVNRELHRSIDVKNKTGSVTNMDLNFGAQAKNKEAYYLSSLKIMRYAISHIHHPGWDNLSVDDKLFRLYYNYF